MLGLGVGSASAFGDVALHEESEFHGGSPPQTNVDLTDRQILIDSGTAGTDRQGPWKAGRGRRVYGGVRWIFPLPAPSRYQGLRPWTPGVDEPTVGRGQHTGQDAGGWRGAPVEGRGERLAAGVASRRDAA
ncbi:hypothetical protein GCM10022420_003270 [Streptomyces iranensis]